MSRILIAIKVCHRYVPAQGRGWDWTNKEKHRASNSVDWQIKACRETWVKDLAAYPDVDVIFFYGRGANRQPLSDEVFLECGDDYRSLPHKTKAICTWAAARPYEHIFLTDDDTYIWADRLMSSGFEVYDYVGAVSELSRYPYATGLGYWISAKAARFVAGATPSSSHTMEDHWVGEVLHKHGVVPKCDHGYRSVGPKFVGAGNLFNMSEFSLPNIAVHPCNPEMLYACHARAHEPSSAVASPAPTNPTALVVIATGSVYRQHARDFIASAKQFFVPHDVVLFTDAPWEFNDVPIKFKREHLGFPRATLTRYHAIWGACDVLSKYDHVFYSDADMLFVAPVTTDEVFSNGITATEHPGYVGLQGSPEKNPQSTAYLPHTRTYFCGGFNGGTSGAFLEMADTIRKAVDADDAKGILAIWHDESHLNRYLYDHPPAKVLTPSFCYPEEEISSQGNGYWGNIWKRAHRHGTTPKLICLKKDSREDVPSPPPPPPEPEPTPNSNVSRCNRHNIQACAACIKYGWQFRQPDDPAPAHIGSDIHAAAPQQATPRPAPPQPNPQVQRAASRALTGPVKPSQGALYRNNRGTDNQRKIR
jgi:hypothetical protein